MVVKKFEARTMKEALEMVKAELGPEAIIVGARDNSKRYGLVGEGSVEITAAIQESNLQKKMLAESKMTDSLRDKIHRGSAKAHRDLIEKATTKVAAVLPPPNKNEPVKVSRGPIERAQRYIDMEDDVEPAAAPNGANEKLKIAAQRAWKVMLADKEPEDRIEIRNLQNQLLDLQKVVKTFHEVPQTLIHGHPGSQYGIRYELAGIFEKLCGVGLNTGLAAGVLKQVQAQLPENHGKNRGLIYGLVAQTLAKNILIADWKQNRKFEVFVGAGGHGKTSTLIKYAAQLVLRDHQKVAILTTDNQKFGAGEQLKIYAQILNLPFMVVTDEAQWRVIAEEASGFDKILVDSPGVRFRSVDEMHKLRTILPPTYLEAQIHLVISATAKDQDAIALGQRFATIGFDDVIFTALDESAQHGMLLNFQEAIGKPFHSFGIGSRVPEDFEQATKERVIDLLLGQTDDCIAAADMNF